MSTAAKKEFNGHRMGAILLMALDEELTAEVFQHFSQKEISDLSHEMATLGQVPHEEMEKVINGFYDETEEMSQFGGGSSDYIRSVLVKVLGPERAATLLEDIMETSSATHGIDALNLIEASTVAEMIRDEHPQIIATVLVHLERRQSADILECLNDKLRNDVVLRIATFSGVQPSALVELTEVLSNMLEGQNLKRSKMGGIKTAAEIINLMNSATEENIMDNIRAYREDLAQRIIDEMFLFENLVELDDRSIQLILKEVDSNVLAIALKGADEDLQAKFINNLSQRAGEMLIDNMENSGPVRVSQVEAEQKTILQVVRRLVDSGEVVLASGEDTFV